MAPPRSDKSLRLASYLLSLCPNQDPFVLSFSYEKHAARLDFSTRTLARALEPLLTEGAVHVQRRGAAPPTLTLRPKALRLLVEIASPPPPPDAPPPSTPAPDVLQFAEQLATLSATVQALNLTAQTLNTTLSQLSDILQPLLSGLSAQAQAVASLLSTLTTNPPPPTRPDLTPPQPTAPPTNPPAQVASESDAQDEGQGEALAQLRQLVELAGGQSATDRLLGFNKKGRVNDAFRRGRVSKDLADKVSAALARFTHTKV